MLQREQCLGSAKHMVSFGIFNWKLVVRRSRDNGDSILGTMVIVLVAKMDSSAILLLGQATKSSLNGFCETILTVMLAA